MTEDQHKLAIEANIKVFDSKMADEYDNREAIHFLSIFFAKSLLEFDMTRPRKTLEESSKIIGDPEKLYNGVSPDKSLPDPHTFKTQFPNSAFKPGMKLMDFACGTGILTQHFARYLATDSGQKSEIVGIDINPAFLAKFKEKANQINAKYNGVAMTSYLCDILDPTAKEVVSQFEDSMDLIVCTISYHHIDNYEKVTQKLASFLRPGGWLYIVDFYNEDVETSSSTKSASHAVRHMGGLKVDALNRTLGEYSNLTNVSSAREARVYLWQEQAFIEHHLPEEINKKLKDNQLRSKISNGTTVYLVETSLILAIGQKK
ncbi:uncharacterized protein AC631_02229 [Debaryomyces fabryi]|uniref:Methyltransferase domain-containing protein n=1 Tax=Debaryomyces fabryi TaxID=58627 RepID=A0A0V1Q0M8_9ASCO|nr:uncharacterized protein AC631_02229 [Debaryomyces fabryi]KSA02016.1 hypothetical protein AC631_02229 [Debaryomyces fabryi]CUM51336.1 unnamed protein product [Debaryomyces fabryi]